MEICKIVERLKAKSSFGVDGVSNLLLKCLVHIIKGPLCTIFNRSLQEGVFPDLMKLARVVTLFKSRDVTLPDNYRPISLLPVISKVLERIVYHHLSNHLEQEGLLYP